MNEQITINGPMHEAEIKILAFRDQVAAMGANGPEFFELDEIKNKLLKGELSPKEAVKKAFDIRHSKQEDH